LINNRVKTNNVQSLVQFSVPHDPSVLNKHYYYCFYYSLIIVYVENSGAA